MHPTFGPGDPPPNPLWDSRPAPHSEESRVKALRRRTRRIDRRLVTVNAACFAALVVLSGAAPGLLAVEVVGRINLGLLSCLALGLLVLCTSVAYDRRLTQECDPEAEAIRLRREQSAAAEEAAANARRHQQQWNTGRGWSEW